ncbi:Putative Mg2+ transporter protein, CorA-like/Zinc transport protein ZntB [Septoria linicola]|uniref:Mg2+ transporter protein, CorA-like/Zinc transport protein ZntB n=1 Tax=Septoria linicola TaxID=215465 RepID=A0A9Q9AV13_9PEZI|nr:Putative Mg2+ transporter protein, CorA-like/Zinc transport protein ZntB [Septoria linicola]
MATPSDLEAGLPLPHSVDETGGGDDDGIAIPGSSRETKGQQEETKSQVRPTSDKRIKMTKPKPYEGIKFEFGIEIQNLPAVQVLSRSNSIIECTLETWTPDGIYGITIISNISDDWRARILAQRKVSQSFFEEHAKEQEKARFELSLDSSSASSVSHANSSRSVSHVSHVSHATSSRSVRSPQSTCSDDKLTVGPSWHAVFRMKFDDDPIFDRTSDDFDQVYELVASSLISCCRVNEEGDISYVILVSKVEDLTSRGVTSVPADWPEPIFRSIVYIKHWAEPSESWPTKKQLEEDIDEFPWVWFENVALQNYTRASYAGLFSILIDFFDKVSDQYRMMDPLTKQIEQFSTSFTLASPKTFDTHLRAWLWTTNFGIMTRVVDSIANQAIEQPTIELLRSALNARRLVQTWLRQIEKVSYRHADFDGEYKSWSAGRAQDLSQEVKLKGAALVEEFGDTYDLLLGAIQVNDSEVNKRLAHRTTILAILAAIYLPFTLTTGVFGMNIREIAGPGGDTPFTPPDRWWAVWLWLASTVVTFLTTTSLHLRAWDWVGLFEGGMDKGTLETWWKRRIQKRRSLTAYLIEKANRYGKRRHWRLTFKLVMIRIYFWVKNSIRRLPSQAGSCSRGISGCDFIAVALSLDHARHCLHLTD